MKRVLFIEPKAPGFHIFSRFPLPRLGCFLLGTILKERGWDVNIIIEGSSDLHIHDLEPVDVVCISTITSTAPRAYEIADMAHKLGKTVIMGGSHVTFLPDEALDHADFVFRGEADHSIEIFAQIWEKGGNYSKVPGLSYRKGNKKIHNPQGALVGNLDTLPILDYDLLTKAMCSVSGFRIIPVQTSRGCPFDCSFCSVTGMFGKKFRFRSHDHVMKELVRYNKKGDFVFFYDDNFTANKERTKELLNRMIKEGPGFPWSTQVRADVARDEELVRLMKRANCHTLFIGFESINEKSLKEMKKSQTIKEISHAIKVIKRNGIHIHGMFVFGFDDDTMQTVKETIEFTKKVQLTSLQFLILTPLPGSKFYNELVSQNRITSFQWEQYDTHHVVYKPKHFTPYDLQMAQIHGHSKLFSIPEIGRKLISLNFIGTGLGIYANLLNRTWQKKNREYLEQLKRES